MLVVGRVICWFLAKHTRAPAARTVLKILELELVRLSKQINQVLSLLADVRHFINALTEVLPAVFVVACLFFDVCTFQLLLKVMLTLVLRSQTFA